MIDEWAISDKHIRFVTDNARDINRAISDLINYKWVECYANVLYLSLGKAVLLGSRIQLQDVGKR